MPYTKGTVIVDDAAAPNAASAGTMSREIWDSLILMVPEYIGPSAAESLAAKVAHYRHAATLANAMAEGLCDYLNANAPTSIPTGTLYQHLEHNGTAWAAVHKITVSASGGLYGVVATSGDTDGGDVVVVGGSAYGNADGGKAKLVAGARAGTGGYGEAQMCGEDGMPEVRVGEQCLGFYGIDPITIQTCDYDDPAVETLARTSANVRRVWDALIALGLITGSAYDFGA